MPGEQLVEDAWPLGWIPSSSEQSDFGAPSQGLLRMDNLTLDEKGAIRLINRPTPQINAATGVQINSVYGALVNTRKLRYYFDANGNLWRNYGPANSATIYDLGLGVSGGVQKAAWLNALGHVINLAGNIQIKDRGDIQWGLTIPQPAAPTAVAGGTALVQLSNLDVGLNYTNWVITGCSSSTNTSTEIDFTPNTFQATLATTYATPIDTTNFGDGTGNDTPNDLVTFQLETSDITQFNSIEIWFFINPAGGQADYYQFSSQLGFQASGAQIFSQFQPTLSNGNFVTIQIPRSAFNLTQVDSNVGWNTVIGVNVVINSFGTATTYKFKNIYFGSAAVSGTQQYLCVELNDTGQFVQFSIASTVQLITIGLNGTIVSRPSACDPQCNEIRFYRNDPVLGQFLEINRQSGAYGFTPTSFVDSLSDATVIADAALDTSRVLQYFRTNLPLNIIGAIYFASRVIYLTTTSFLPSFQLDFGTYDSRFEYQLTGTNSEICLFLARLSVNTFIVATTVDFYQITGDFTTVSTTNPDGTTTTTLNVVVSPLGISDPAISREFAEVEGNLFYMSSRGLRSMVNGVSTLLNTTTDLLFRNETRYGFPPVALLPNDQSQIGIVSSGTRIYIAVPFSNGANAILVSTYNPPLPAELRGSNYWRPIISNALCLAREGDGTVIYGDNTGSIFSLEDNLNSASTINLDMLTQYNFGQNPTSTKKLSTLILAINTGGTGIVLTVYGLTEGGTIVPYVVNITAAGLTILPIDITLPNCVAFAYNLLGTTGTFELLYSMYLIVEGYPPITFYQIIPLTNFGTNEEKQLSKWSFVLDCLGNNATVKVICDGIVLSTQTIVANTEGIFTASWYNFNNVIGTDWQIEVIAPQGMHFFKFLDPTILQKYPTLTYYAIVPFSNLGKDTLKKLSKWGFVIDTLGNEVTARVTADNAVIDSTIDQSAEPQGISTEFWYNEQDVAALDWQLEIIAPSGMRFYKFMTPDIMQVYPPGRLLDQVGPLDLDKQGICFGFRARMLTEGATFHYEVLDEDILVYSNDIVTVVNEDATYIEKWPKGINTSVLRLVITSATLMYRSSLEFLVRITGNDTDAQWIKLQNK